MSLPSLLERLLRSLPSTLEPLLPVSSRGLSGSKPSSENDRLNDVFAADRLSCNWGPLAAFIVVGSGWGRGSGSTLISCICTTEAYNIFNSHYRIAYAGISRLLSPPHIVIYQDSALPLVKIRKGLTAESGLELLSAAEVYFFSFWATGSTTVQFEHPPSSARNLLGGTASSIGARSHSRCYILSKR